jgi:hypothetical protein
MDPRSRCRSFSKKQNGHSIEPTDTQPQIPIRYKTFGSCIGSGNSSAHSFFTICTAEGQRLNCWSQSIKGVRIHRVGRIYPWNKGWRAFSTCIIEHKTAVAGVHAMHGQSLFRRGKPSYLYSKICVITACQLPFELSAYMLITMPLVVTYVTYIIPFDTVLWLDGELQ